MSFIQPLFWGGRHCRTIVLNRSERLAGSLERIPRFQKCEWNSVRSPSAERLGTTVLHFLTAQAGSKASLSMPITDTIAIIGVFPVVPRKSPWELLIFFS